MSNFPEHRARKRFGQNFLRDGGVIDRIHRSVCPQPDDALIEIGPGQGAITGYLAESGADLTLIELDRDLVAILELQLAKYSHINIIQADALKTDFGALQPDTPDFSSVELSRPRQRHALYAAKRGSRSTSGTAQ